MSDSDILNIIKNDNYVVFYSYDNMVEKIKSKTKEKCEIPDEILEGEYSYINNGKKYYVAIWK